jgi:hypothetical protein
VIVFDLVCAGGHRFESWFRDGAAFDEQAAAGAVTCPACGETAVVKAPTRLNIARHGRRAPGDGSRQPGSGGEAAPGRPDPPPAMAEVLAELRRRVEAACDYVGPAFAEEARRIHYGEVADRPIYGEASVGEANALVEEGIAVQPLPWLPRRDG